MTRKPVDRFIDGIEVTAAGFLAAVTALTFVSVFLRYFLAWSIPDAYDISCLLLGILIFWGMAIASYRGEHICVDLVWTMSPRWARRAMDILSGVLTLGSMLVFTAMMWTKVLSTREDNVLTFDTHMPVWLFYLVAWAGLAAAVALLCIRTVRLLLQPEALETAPHASSVE